MGANICYIDVKIKRRWQDSDVTTDIEARKVESAKVDGVEGEAERRNLGAEGKKEVWL